MDVLSTFCLEVVLVREAVCLFKLLYQGLHMLSDT